MEMKTSSYSKIKRLYELQCQDRKYLGDYINLCYIIKGRNFNQKDIRNAFLKLVSRDEYDFKEREELIQYLYVVNQR